MNRIESKQHRYERRKKRVKKHFEGTPTRLRLTIFRSAAHIYAQIIDDAAAKTLVSASTVDREVKSQIVGQISKVDESRLVGNLLAQRAKAAKINQVAFDRNGFLYHGRVKALADAAREGGLDF
ncbi:MAG: 50S ribosomal protein L18 [Ignavibacteriae bacterium]|nr:MAG: 50S ribosomal protein L18 [Ignavibacteriota bacterium]